ncbi:ABC transporter substrate-binding protein [Sulfuracidifex metallicus]|uniref:Peptide ABC transporter substrate-binding protein n=1 Tax=Sulfuracidifex metallicus DSM 6482 = JCM 9184 TaxID=523847 RepID=A0A6A9QQ21_SULME|nr:ABC transporter substrate-binding protein [Sulfuracidifex metallicus]MUN29858.1 peptide ABC transporter substrate-binding protein [Sulfuracidifex metallicus DSM 6482 = JCM 9184]WOE51757.1 ABC transporter substrate-binding protein [Sulfuracidifex metallicus DSM 6482 = JCM 9184]
MENKVRRLITILTLGVLLFSIIVDTGVITEAAYVSATAEQPVINWYEVSYTCPWVGSIEYVFTYGTHSAEFSALQDGKIDFATITHQSDFKTGQHDPNLWVNASVQESFFMLVFAYGNPLTANLNFRYAIQSLINYNNITTSVDEDGLLGVGTPFYLYPEVPAYKPYVNPEAAVWYSNYESYNPSRAVSYLEKIPGVTHVDGKWYYNGSLLKLTFTYPTGDTPAQNLATYLQTAAASINLTIVPEAESFATLIGAATTPPFNGFNITTFGWINLGPFANSWMQGIYTSPSNTGGFSNSTIDKVLSEALTAPTLSAAATYVKEADLYLQQQLPYVIISWTNAVDGVYLPGWADYIYLNVTSEYAFSFLNVHPRGEFLNGTFVYSSVSSSEPRHINPYASASVYAFNVLDDIYPGLAFSEYANQTALLPNIAENWTLTPISSMTLPNGGKIVNGSILTINLVHNATWINGVPITAYDVNFTIWWLDLPGMLGTNTFDGLHVNYTYLYNNGFISTDYFGSQPYISWTNVTSPYQIKIYMNGSTYTDEFYAIDGYPIYPAFVFNTTNPATVYSERIADLLGGGGYYFAGVFNNYEEYLVKANLHYPRINALIFLKNVTAGSTYTYTDNVTAYVWNNASLTNMPVQISNATVYVYLKYLGDGMPYENVTINGKPFVVMATNDGNGVYTANINTSSLKPGTYEIVAKAVWNAGGATRELFNFGSIAVSPTTTTTVPPATTTTTSTSFPITYVIIGIVVIIIIAAAVVLLRRR